MTRPAELFRVVIDNSGITHVLDQVDAQLKQHDVQIQELFRLVGNLPTKADLEALRTEIGAAVHKVKNSMGAEIKAALAAQDLVGQFDHLQDDFSRSRGDIRAVTDRISQCETQTSMVAGHLQTLASAHAALNKTTASLDHTLPRTLMNATNVVNQKFENIYEQLKELGSAIEAEIEADAAREAAREPPIDLSSLQLREAVTFSFSDSPILPLSSTLPISRNRLITFMG
jgi:chromosome segregation ATPase